MEASYNALKRLREFVEPAERHIVAGRCDSYATYMFEVGKVLGMRSVEQYLIEEIAKEERNLSE